WEQDLLPFLDELPTHSDILEIQRIKNVRILLQIPDVFSFFQINNKDIFKLKEQACFIDDNSNYIVRPGIRSDIEQFIELLKNHCKPTQGNLDLIDSNHVFACEDSTSVVSSVSYDSKTNCFIGFAPKLVNGLPLINQFQTNTFNELQEWFQELEKSK
ncbi:unnamed protein product, partial [Rotaria magnacalcarata]